MKARYTNILTLLFAMQAFTALAQPVSRVVLVEQFTNSYCSVCASRNPGFYQNLAQFPTVLHISYYPSSPYPQCPINQYNKPEADARTNYYGVFGGTPRLIIQGTALPTSANYNSNTIFQSVLGTTTSFGASLQLTMLNSTTAEVRFTVKKVDTSSLDSVSLYVAIVEDTLNFNAANGEQAHYNVFRRSALGTMPLRMKTPTNTGDSIVATTTITIDPQWPLSKMYGIGIVQKKNGELLQATLSGKLSSSGTSVPALEANAIKVYPNPAKNIVHIENAAGSTLIINDIMGKQLMRQSVDASGNVSTVAWPSGNYIFRILKGAYTKQFLITKQ